VNPKEKGGEAMTNYDKIPEHCRGGMRRYVEEGVIPGEFLQAVICNDLVESFGRADDINSDRLRDYAGFLYNEIPSLSWGSKEKMRAWAKMKETEPIKL